MITKAIKNYTDCVRIKYDSTNRTMCVCMSKQTNRNLSVCQTACQDDKNAADGGIIFGCLPVHHRGARATENKRCCRWCRPTPRSGTQPLPRRSLLSECYRLHGTRRRENHGLPCAVFTKPNNDQKDYVQVYYAEFHPNTIINAELRI